MSYIPSRTFPDAAQQASIWVCELADRLGCEQREAYEILRAGLHALRDSMAVEDHSELANHLPVLLRGIFYESWHPTAVGSGPHPADHVLAGVGTRLNCGEAESRKLVATVLEILEFRLNSHITAKLRALLRERSQWLRSDRKLSPAAVSRQRGDA